MTDGVQEEQDQRVERHMLENVWIALAVWIVIGIVAVIVRML